MKNSIFEDRNDLRKLVSSKTEGLGISIKEYLVGLVEDDLAKDGFSSVDNPLDYAVDYEVVSSGDPVCDEICEQIEEDLDTRILKRYDSDDFIEI